MAQDSLRILDPMGVKTIFTSKPEVMLIPEYEMSGENTVHLKMNYGAYKVLNKSSWPGRVVDKRPKQVDIVMTLHPSDTSAWREDFYDLIKNRGSILLSNVENSGAPNLSGMDLTADISLINTQKLVFFEVVDTTLESLLANNTNLDGFGSSFNILNLSNTTTNSANASNGGNTIAISLQQGFSGVNDLISSDFFARIKALNISVEDAKLGVVISFPGGCNYVVSEDKFYYSSYPNNPFLTLVELINSPS